MLNNIKTIHNGTRYRIKDREKSEVFYFICQHPGVTRKEIVNISNIRPSTVSKIMKELLAQNLVFEGANKNIGEKGRPEFSMHPNSNRFLSIALYVVSKKVKGVLLNFNDDIIGEETVSIPLNVENDRIIDILKNLILSVAAKTPDNSTLLGVGISLMGSRNIQTGELVNSSRWNKLKRLSINRLEELTGLKCRLYNALSAELEYLLLKNSEYRTGITVLYHWGYGIGLNFAFEGNIFYSQFCSTGEVGHITVDKNSNNVCRCGKKGCLETKAALWSLAAQLEESYPDIPDDEKDFFNYSILNNLFSKPLIQKATGYIIENLNAVYLLLSPDRILLTGPFVNDEKIMARINSEFYNNLPDYASDHVKLEVLSNEFIGEIFGSTYSFFRETLSRELLCD